ncbi:MAG: ferritin [Ardenticatenia bacterium]|nr:ferritin [Ardenticatenia bacterium]
MFPEALQEALNEQIQREFYAAYLYLSMAAYFEAINLPGFASWMRHQSEEEVGHAMRLFNFVNDRGGRVILQAIEQPPAEFESPLAAFEAALAHEQRVTRHINDIYELAVRENDYPTQVELHWFITEQVEEEHMASQIVEQLRMVGDQPVGLLMMDKMLGEREGEEE